MRRLMAAGKRRVTVGIHDEQGSRAHPGSGATIGEIAGYHELGLGVPRRSMIADWSDENEAKNVNALRSAAKGVVTGKFETLDQALDAFGSEAVRSVQDRIRAGIAPPL